MDLTDKIWDKIKVGLEEHLAKIRFAILDRIRVVQVKKRVMAVNHVRQTSLKDHPEGMVVPCLADLCFIKEFKSLLDLPTEIDAPDDMFSEAAKCLSDMCTWWRRAAEEKLVALLPPVNVASEPDSTEGRLRLGKSAFACTVCYSTTFLDFTQALEHSCCMAHFSWKPVDEDLHEIYSMTQKLPWRAEGVLRAIPSEGLMKIIEQCGMNSCSATWAEMDKLDFRFTCTHCNNSDQVLIMTWRQAVKHVLTDTSCSTLCADATSLISGPELTAILQEEREQVASHPIWCCSLCDTSLTFVTLTAHLLNEHEIGMVDKKYYYFNHHQRFVTQPWHFKKRVQDAEQGMKSG